MKSVPVDISLPDIVNKFIPVSLEEMGRVKLMNRIDSKYLTTCSGLLNVLGKAAECGFMAQEIGDERWMPYYTCYYDTPDVNMYYEHQRGKKARQKIRLRSYEGSDSPTFLEIKDKDNKGRTRKKRVAIDEDADIYVYSDFIRNKSKYDVSGLMKAIENRFKRLTIVSPEWSERITIDTSISFHNFKTNENMSLEGLVVVEWKRDARSSNPLFGRFLREYRIFQTGFSKYCVGMALTDPSLQQGLLKPRLRFIERIIQNEEAHLLPRNL